MGPIAQLTIELVESVPGFRQAVDRAASLKRKRPVLARLSQAADSPSVLYAMLEYAASIGVAVTFVPGRE